MDLARGSTGSRLPKSGVPVSHLSAGFDFTLHARKLCAAMAERLPELHHVQMDRVAVGFRQTRKRVSHGLQASLTPMRFQDGSLFTERGGRRWTLQRLYDPLGKELLYILTFYLPRFLEQTFREKLVTVLHELWHISPQFDGDLRRHPGRCYAHSSSQRHYDAEMEQLADRWLSTPSTAEVDGFLRLSFQELRGRHGTIYGARVATPKLMPAS